MDLTIVVAIIILGLLIIMAEVFLIPGTTIVGILGFLVVLVGITIGYATLGTRKGHYLLVVSMVATGLLLFIGFKMYTSQRFALKERIDSKVNVPEEAPLLPGTEGITVTSLRPTGKVRFGHKLYLAYAIDDFIQPETKVKVVKTEQNKIFVKPV